jgi:hypothetical protein
VTTRTERRYRRLLWAYPRSYRDHRGTEILTTLLEMAEDGRRPGLHLHLILSGLRERFRLPARRPLAWVAALLAAAVLGGFGAAAGTWTAWRTASALPSDQELHALNATLGSIPADASHHHETSAQRGPSVLIVAEGITDSSSSRVRDTLTGAGWRITSFRESDAPRAAPREDMDLRLPSKFFAWTATRDGLKMEGHVWVFTGSLYTGLGTYRFKVWPVEPAVLRPLTIAGTVAGLLAGWLLVAGLARHRLATALAAAGLAVATLPAYRFYREAYDVMAYPHGSPDPGNVPVALGATLTAICTVAGLLAIVTAAIVARPQPAVQAG